MYGNYYADQLKALRYSVLKQAADGAGLCGRDSPLRAKVGDLIARGLKSDDAFAEALTAFDRLRADQARELGRLTAPEPVGLDGVYSRLALTE